MMAAAILLSQLGWTGSNLVNAATPVPPLLILAADEADIAVLQTDDGEIIPLCDPPKREEMMMPPVPPPSPATAAPGVRRCRLPGSFPLEPPAPPRPDLPVPGTVTSP